MSGFETDTVNRLETNLDDCSPEWLGALMERLMASGALDVWFTPIQMKKHRPGVMLSVLCEEAATEMLANLIFSESTAFGLRMEKVLRLKLHRRFETVTTEFGEVILKLGLKGDQVVQVAPEFESCNAAARESGQPLRSMRPSDPCQPLSARSS